MVGFAHSPLYLTLSHTCIHTHIHLHAHHNYYYHYYDYFIMITQEVKPAFDKLAQHYQHHKSILIAEVDCDKEGFQYCKEQFGVEVFPWIKYFTSKGKDTTSKGNDYVYGRSYGRMQNFVRTELGGQCNVQKSADSCSPKELAYLQKVQNEMTSTERANEAVRLEKEISDHWKMQYKKQSSATFDRTWTDQKKYILSEIEADEMIKAYLPEF
jgi:hypothetical protein